jgi:V/A-type H+-transporting ATPase subunit K
MFFYVFLSLFAATIIVPSVIYRLGERTEKRGKRALAGNLISFGLLFTAAVVFLFTNNAYAAEAASQLSDTAIVAAFASAAVVTSVGCISTGIAVGQAATAAIGAISENEKIQSKALIFVAMAEGIAIYGLLVSFMILGNV